MFFSMGKIDSSRFHYNQMKQHYDKYKNQLESNPQLNSSFAKMFAGLGERKLALEHMETAMEIMPLSRDALVSSGLFTSYLDVFFLLGETKTQVAYVDTILSKPNNIGLGWILVDPDYRKAVEHPDFLNIMEKHADSIQWHLYRERYGT